MPLFVALIATVVDHWSPTAVQYHCVEMWKFESDDMKFLGLQTFLQLIHSLSISLQIWEK